MKILLTGATGFVGKALGRQLLQDSAYDLLALLRSPSPIAFDSFVLGDLASANDLRQVLEKVDVIIHLAARVHVMKDNALDPLSEFRRVNVAATLNLARHAIEAGVRRFIFLSSIKVNGETTKPMKPFTADVTSAGFQSLDGDRESNKSSPRLDPYGYSKFEAEQGLRQIYRGTDRELVIIRPPLIYGAGVKGNFQKMMKWIYGSMPLPLGSIENQRSLVYIDNLISLIKLCIEHPSAVNQTFLVSDGQDLSTSQLFRHLASLLGKQSRLINFPQRVLKCILLIMGRKDIYQRLCENLQVDIQKTRDLLNWKPPVSVEVGLENTAKSWLEDHVT